MDKEKIRERSKTRMKSVRQSCEGAFAIYECGDRVFRYSDCLQRTLALEPSGPPLWTALAERGALSQEEAKRLEGLLRMAAGAVEPVVFYAQARIGEAGGSPVRYTVGFICGEPGKQVIVTFQPEDDPAPQDWESGAAEDEPTGLMGHRAFLVRLEQTLREEGCPPDGGAVVYFDVQRFKAINGMFGMAKGDRLLAYIAAELEDTLRGRGFAGHLNADRFVFFIRAGREETEEAVERLFDGISAFGLPYEILCNAGICRVEEDIAADTAMDRAILAQKKVKGSYTRRFDYYSEELQKDLLGEQEIVGAMRAALRDKQFLIYYQPQYNHSTGMLVGAEALARWLHPEKGIIPPGQFIPVFESNGFISQLDMYIFEQACIFQKRCLDQGLQLVPVSVNLSRYDIYSQGFLERLEKIRADHGVPAKYIRIEITESSALGGSRIISEAVNVLHGYGYVVEMDDFGSGYSSLNILKDIDFDVIKLDMRFLGTEGGRSGRGGTILSSVVRMVNWLQLPVIAEGVETQEQADFLKSIGCDCIQGYFYSKPLPEAEFDALLRGSHVGRPDPGMQLVKTMDAGKFWSSDSLETLIFSNYVGAAAIFDYTPGGKAEILRVNPKYVHELGMNLTEKEMVNRDLISFLDEAGEMLFRDMLEKAIETGEEQECETWRKISSSCCGEDKICLRSTVQMIGRSKESYIFYAMIRNTTAEKQRWIDVIDNERRFKAASEQVNIYYWEYTVATHEMRPCFRCMRDLGLPALLTNYPESAIERGVFPPEAAPQYREWHRQIDAGEVKSLEAVMPLTVGRIPFHVRYTVEFDESGCPVKAYGSAALVVHEDEKKA